MGETIHLFDTPVLSPQMALGILVVMIIAAVSYTHLDVYKRQRLPRAHRTPEATPDEVPPGTPRSRVASPPCQATSCLLYTSMPAMWMRLLLSTVVLVALTVYIAWREQLVKAFAPILRRLRHKADR